MVMWGEEVRVGEEQVEDHQHRAKGQGQQQGHVIMQVVGVVVQVVVELEGVELEVVAPVELKWWVKEV